MLKTEKELEFKELGDVLANERTYAAWMRTGLTSLATGLGVERFLGGVIPEPFIRTVSMVLLSFSFVAFLLGAWRYHIVGTRLTTEKITGASIPLLISMSLFLAFISLLASVGVWLV